MRSCGHTLRIACAVDLEEERCTEKCIKTRSCGHECTKLCSDDCDLCETLLTKERSCGHSFENVMCHEDVETLGCNAKCLLSLACGHHCTKTCKEECNPCMEMVKKLRSCGHATKVVCSSADPEQEPCKRKCKKTLDCGHDCTKFCSDDCIPCAIKVTKFKSCGHSLDNIMCHEDVEAVVCKKRCLKALPCGHRCTNSCDEECSAATECTEMVNKLRSCGHMIIVACSADPEQAPICTLQCTKTLDCGHDCSKLCFDVCKPCETKVKKSRSCGHISKSVKCHKDIEVQKCFKKCGKILKCGHCCFKTCSEDCYPCEQMVNKMRYCGHSVTVACNKFADPVQEQCIEQCTVTLDCGHDCTKLCFENCRPCEIELRSCGHNVEVPCHMSLENVVCSGNCLKTLECGHECTKLCHEACGPCPTLVEKKIRECGHYIQVPCYDSHSELNRAQCYNMCTLILKCGHQCKQPCKNIYCDLFNPCEESVPAVGTCGHVIARQCYEEKTGLPVDIRNCTEPCNSKLLCGHTCSGTCATCHQGRFHVPCKQKCGRTQICGHSCNDQCGVYCPPCQEGHVLNCDHGSWMLSCNEIANVCRRDCIQICKHKTAILSKCSEQRHCDNRCEKFLLCNHQCFGFCGEPCPPLCWICDRSALMTNAFSKDTVVYPLDPRFILLRRCGHIFESRSLGRWLQWQDSRIEIKTCPRCNLNIDGQGHFSGHIFYPVIDRTLINLNNKSHPSKAKMLLDILGSLKEKSPLTSELTEEIKYMSVTPSEMTSRALTQYQTKVKVTSIMDAIIFTLRSHGYLDLSHGNKIEEKVTFLTQMLNSKNAIWIQQNADFSSLLKDLLLTVSLEVKTRELKQTSLIKIFSRLNPFTKSASQQLDAIDHRVSVSYHLIKDSWRKCIKCKKAFFTPLGSPNGACMWCKSMLISKPDFTI